MELKKTLTPEEVQEKQQEIINLMSQLSSTQSDIGDWKITKTYEARMREEADPYDTKARWMPGRRSGTGSTNSSRKLMLQSRGCNCKVGG